MSSRLSRAVAGSGLLIGILCFTRAYGQSATTNAEIITSEKYLTPPPEFAKLVMAEPDENLSGLSPDRKYFLRQVGDWATSVSLMSRATLNLGGLEIDPVGNREKGLASSSATGLELVDPVTGQRRSLETPAGATIASAVWSPTSAQIAFLANFENATYLYLADAASGKSRRLLETPVLGTLARGFDWSRDGKVIAIVTVPEWRKPKPDVPSVAIGPQVRVNKPGERNRTRTFFDLLEWPYEQDMVEFYTTGQLVLVNVANGGVKKVGEPAMIQSVDLSYDGGYARVRTMLRPFSYEVEVGSSGSKEELWDAHGKVLYQLSKTTMEDNLRMWTMTAPTPPPDTGKKGLTWKPNGPGMFYYLSDKPPSDSAKADSTRADSAKAAKPDSSQADSTKPKPKLKHRLVEWRPPFGPNDTVTIYQKDNPFSMVGMTANGQLLFVSETINNKESRTYAVYLSDTAKTYTLIPPAPKPDTTKPYDSPGSLYARDYGGAPMMTPDGKSVYLSGNRNFPNPIENPPQAWIDRVEIQTGARTRVYEAPTDIGERIVAVLDDDFKRLVISRESSTIVPNTFYRDSSGTLTQLTKNVDRLPEITNAQRLSFQVTRQDGFKFWVKVTLPANYQTGTRLPAMFWFYPREVTSQQQYDQGRQRGGAADKRTFPRVRRTSMELLITQGYAVVEPDCPIVGKEGTMNDNYVVDLRNNLAAVIDELDRRAIVDRARLGIGGHSYGAFSTANALAHTPFFKAGIAGDGNYNRTLTPNMFQREQRLLWEARSTYLEMSPFIYADRINGALLMYHGADDSNVGTHPVNAVRLFHALRGLGKTAALYMYPYEDHGPSAKETILDMWARWLAWLDTYVKNPSTEAKTYQPMD